MNMSEIIGALLVKNRTIVSSEMTESFELLARELPLTLHRYASGEDHGTWVIPPTWNVRHARLSDGVRTIAAYEDHPLFVAPYSSAFSGWVDRAELLAHIHTAPQVPDAYAYEHRLAYDYRRRLKEWRISVPHSVVRTLDAPRYHVDIDVETGSGHMLVAQGTIEGRHDGTFALLTHLCHTGQANDGLAGVAVGIEVMRRIRKRHPRPQHTYELLVMPETIGSAVYLASDESRIDRHLGAVFLEMAGIRSPLRLGRSRRDDTYLDRVFRHALRARGAPFVECRFMEQWGNDELVFDSAGVGVPTVSLERYPFDRYHTSADNLEAVDERSLGEFADILMDVVEVLESDFIPRPRQRVPVYLTRYDLYADWHAEKRDYDLNAAILGRLYDGASAFDIAASLAVPYDRVRAYLQRFVDHELVDALPVTPTYTRQVGVSLDR